MRRALVVGLATVAVVATGCGGDEAATPRGATEPQGVEPDKGSPGAAEPSGGKIDIAVRGYAFQPTVMRLKTSQIIVWTNEDEVEHNVVGAAPGLHSGLIPPRGRYEFTPVRPGRIAYRCTVHPSMRGELVVGPR
ncbi:MAG TPA: hypothetical protein VGJ70_15320 [Solirubrobacteraceae bacterium]